MFFLKKKKKSAIDRSKESRTLDPKEVLSSEILSKIRKLQLKAGWKVTDNLIGKYSSAFRGSGMEFEKLREYVLGDDIRSLDWKVTARMQKAYVREYREERQMSVVLMVDISRAMSWGTDQKTKKDIVLELVAILGFICSKNNDRVSLILFSDKVYKYIPAGRGDFHVWNLIKTTLFSKSFNEQTNLDEALDFLQRTIKKKSTVFIISDFIGVDVWSLARIRSYHDISCVRVYDELEKNLFDVGVINISDLEGDGRILIDSTKLFSEYQKMEQVRVQDLERFFSREKIGYLSLSTQCEDIVSYLETYINNKSKLRRS